LIGKKESLADGAFGEFDAKSAHWRQTQKIFQKSVEAVRRKGQDKINTLARLEV
jgi:hypothetical protein